MSYSHFTRKYTHKFHRPLHDYCVFKIIFQIIRAEVKVWYKRT